MAPSARDLASGSGNKGTMAAKLATCCLVAIGGSAHAAPSGAVFKNFSVPEVPAAAGTPQHYFEERKHQQSKLCPGGTADLLRATNNESLFEAKSAGCENVGDRDEINRFIFGHRSVFHVVYTVKAREMPAKQRDAAMKAVTTWNLLQ